MCKECWGPCKLASVLFLFTSIASKDRRLHPKPAGNRIQSTSSGMNLEEDPELKMRAQLQKTLTENLYTMPGVLTKELNK
jgi:hypothetical protein